MLTTVTVVVCNPKSVIKASAYIRGEWTDWLDVLYACRNDVGFVRDHGNDQIQLYVGSPPSKGNVKDALPAADDDNFSTALEVVAVVSDIDEGLLRILMNSIVVYCY